MINFVTDLPHPYNKIGDGPEGPEARVIADKLRPYLLNRMINNCYVNVIGKMKGQVNCPVKIVNVRSYGKKVIFDLETGQMIVASLGMTGKYLFQQGKHSGVQFEFDDMSIFFDDTRHFGNISVGDASLLSDLGPDLLEAALSEEINSDVWLNIFTAKKWRNKEISQVLMEQSAIAGIGNYLCAEILYESMIAPERKVSNITIDEWENLRVASHKIIAKSYSYGGLTIESFLAPDGSLGVYPAVVYGKTHDPLGNQVVKQKTKNGRMSHWVPGVQK